MRWLLPLLVLLSACSAALIYLFHPLGLPPRVKCGKEGLDPALRAVVAGLANQQAGAG